jgi:3-hydroxy-3-methylglutaryl CoA synthase
VQAGTQPVLVCAGDCRLGEPDSLSEQNYGDAGAALLVGTDAASIVAKIVGTHSVSEEFLGTWRTEGQDFLHSFPGAFENKFGHASFVTAAVKGLLEKTGTRPEQIAAAVIAAPTPRALPAVVKALGLDAKTQLPDSLWTLLGDTGTTQPLLLLAGALERAKPGDLILLASYGDGADAILFQATDALASYRTTLSLFSQVERKRLLASYGRYARFRHLIRKETTPEDVSTPVVLYRDRKAVLSLYGGRCPACGTVQFPKPRVCIECGHRGGIDDHKLSRRGAVFTFTNDYLFESPDSPVAHAVVDLGGGGRVFVQMTDCDADAVAIDLPVELTFRKYHEGAGLNNYFWKARPV